jgi:hypothetical protein
MVNWSADELNEYQAKLTKSHKECAICGKPVGKYKQRVCDDEACTIAYRVLAEKDARRAKCGLPSVDECPDLNDPFKGVPNSCPDCGAAYDPTATASRGSNKRQYTRAEHGIDYDYFECFCKPPVIWRRYK